MDFRNVPSRTEVLSWTPDMLADYFKKLNYKDCEKVVKKHNINGTRFLSMSENDIQKFPKLSVPIISRLSQEISKKQEKKNFLRHWTNTPKAPEEPELKQEESYWSSFEEESEEDDYISPDGGTEKDDGDYESPEEDGAGKDEDGGDYESPVEDVDRDYEPPPSNNDNIGAIFPPKSIIGNQDYEDRFTAAKTQHNPPVPPQRPGHTAALLPSANRGSPFNHYPSPPNNDERRSANPLKPPPPEINRDSKPSLDSLGVHTTLREIRTLPHKAVPKIPKSPQPNDKTPPTSAQTSARFPRPPRPYDTNPDKDEHSGSSRPMQPPAIPSYSSNTFPLTVPQRPSMKPSSLLPGSILAESLHSTGSLPSHGPKGGQVSRSFSHADAMIALNKLAAPASPQNKQQTLNNDWFVGDISRSDADECLRRINKDGTFLVRNSSRKTTSHPFVLMVLFNDKVYNIQIRYDQRQNVYLLGTAGKEHFLSVQEMIHYFKRTPLLLIDGKDPDSRFQCILTNAAGYS